MFLWHVEAYVGHALVKIPKEEGNAKPHAINILFSVQRSLT